MARKKNGDQRARDAIFDVVSVLVTPISRAAPGFNFTAGALTAIIGLGAALGTPARMACTNTSEPLPSSGRLTE
jgi:hypothetical protein